jgi:outer membrane protein TolC
MVKYILSTFVLFFFTPFSYAQGNLELSLEECIKYGLENNRGIKIASEKVFSAELKKEEVKTTGLPTVTLQAGYTRLSEVDPFTITIPFGPTTQSFTVSPSILNNYSAKLTVTQPVFTGFKIDINKEMSDQAINANMQDLEAEKIKLKYSISNAYWSLYKVLEGKKVIEEYIKTLELHIKDVKNFYQQGLITYNEVLKLEVQLSSLKFQLIETDNGIQLVTLSLLNLMNVPQTTKISIKPEIAKKDSTDLQTLEEINNQALSVRPEIKALSFRIKTRESAIQMTKAAWYPDIYLLGNYTYSRPNQRIVPSKDEFNGTWDISLSLSYTLWNWNATSYRTQQAETDLSQTNHQFEMMKDGILIEVKQAYLNLIKNNEKIAVAQNTVKQAEENFRVSSSLFQKGLIKNSDLIDAETALFDSKIKLVTSISDLRDAEALLNKAIGY